MSIPTRYNNVNYRSRLEAKWAKFFDLLGWKHEYEPCDFNGWIPDFVIIGAEIDTFVEIKPVSSFPKNVAKKIYDSKCLDDVDEHGIPKNNVLISGYTLPFLAPFLCVGWLDGRWSWSGGFAEATFCNYVDNKIGFCHSEGDHGDVITGEYIGNFQQPEPEVVNRILDMWKEAGNSTQWKPIKV